MPHTINAEINRTQPASTASREPGRRWWPIGLVLLVAFVGATVLAPAGRHQWALALVRQPARYTALSFQHAAELPRRLGPGGNVDLSFSVTNQEGQPQRYEYIVTSASRAQTAVLLQRATMSIPAGGERSTTVRVHPVCAASPCTVQIALPGHPEAIDALVDLANPSP